MKKLFSIALSLLMLISCFAISVSAAGVNVASADKGASYIYETEVAYLGANADDSLTVLNDGVVPESEVAGQIVSFTGTGVTVMMVIDLGAVYTDITDINFLCVCDSYGDGKSNRGFSGEDTKFRFSTNGVDFERNKDFTMERVDRDDNDATSFYNFNFKFNAPMTAQQVKIEMTNSGGYVLSLGEIEVISASGEGSAPVEPESSEEEIVESEDAAASEDAASTEESEDVASVEESEDAASVEESKEESKDAASKEESKEAASKDTSKDKSKAPTSSNADNGDEGGISPVVIVLIIVAVIAVAVVVIIIMKKRQ